ncbi:MAG: class I SAM-dependent methyltransferase [Cyanobacteria bacterium P01_G01_bin.38]
MTQPIKNAMFGINSYGQELTKEAIAKGLHRDFVGGAWDELGKIQLAFLKTKGLRPEHQFLDIGCGCLRGGLHFISYLNPGNYHGLDINASLIEAAKREIEVHHLQDKAANLLVDDQFKLGKFGQTFDFMVAFSVFTHLPMNIIIRCLSEVRPCLTTNGVLLATFFRAPSSAYLENIVHLPGGVQTNYDSDPFHYAFEEIAMMADLVGLTAEFVDDWARTQKMAVFSPKSSP